MPARHITKSVDLTPADAVDAVFTHFVYDREDVILDFLDADGGGPAQPVLDQRYLHGPQIDQVLAQQSGAGELNWHLVDHLGTVHALVNNSGAIVDQSRFAAFGVIVTNTGPADSRYAFTGREREADSDLMYYRRRYYEPSQGRFLSEDPLHFRSGDFNRYRYVNNQPIAWTDPQGLQVAGADLSWNAFDHCKNSCLGAALPARPWLRPFSTLGAFLAGFGYEVYQTGRCAYEWWSGFEKVTPATSYCHSAFELQDFKDNVQGLGCATLAHGPLSDAICIACCLDQVGGRKPEGSGGFFSPFY